MALATFATPHPGSQQGLLKHVLQGVGGRSATHRLVLRIMVVAMM